MNAGYTRYGPASADQNQEPTKMLKSREAKGVEASPVIRMSRRNIVRSVPLLESLLRLLKSWRLQRFTAPVLKMVVCGLLLVVFQHLSHAVNYKTVVHQLRALPFEAWAGALLATALSYAALAGRDAVGLRYLEAKVPHSVLWVGATVASALGNATGFGALTGGAVRCRVYGAAGIKPAQVGRLTAFTSVTLARALVFLTSLGAIAGAPMLSHAVVLSQTLLHVGGSVGIALLAILLLCCRREPRPVRLGRIGFDIPARSVMLAQLVFA